MLSAMDRLRTPVYERAVQLALSGRYAGIAELKAKLLSEGYRGTRNGRQMLHWHDRNAIRVLILKARNADVYGS